QRALANERSAASHEERPRHELRTLERQRSRSPALVARALEHTLAHAVAADMVAPVHAGIQMLGHVEAVPDHAVALADQVLPNVVVENLDRVGICELVVDEPHAALDVVAVEAHPTRLDVPDRRAAADRAVLVSREGWRPDRSE